MRLEEARVTRTMGVDYAFIVGKLGWIVCEEEKLGGVQCGLADSLWICKQLGVGAYSYNMDFTIIFMIPRSSYDFPSSQAT